MINNNINMILPARAESSGTQVPRPSLSTSGIFSPALGVTQRGWDGERRDGKREPHCVTCAERELGGGERERERDDDGLWFRM